MATNRAKTWMGVKQSVLDKLKIGETYAISGGVRTPSANQKIKLSGGKFSYSLPANSVVTFVGNLSGGSGGPISPTEPPVQISLGDVNLNKKIIIVDAIFIAKYYVGHRPQNFHKENADVNFDNNINIIDALLVSQYYVKIITSFNKK